MAVRDYQFIVGPETDTLPSGGDPVDDDDVVLLGYADSHYHWGGEPVTNIAALQAIAAADRFDGMAIYVKTSKVTYYFDSASSATADGTRIVQPTVGTGRWFRHRAGEDQTTGDVTVDRDLTVTRNLIVTGDATINGTTTTVNTAVLDVEDANIKVNKGGNQATANSNKAGFQVEMTDATDAFVGYDSTLASKFKAGDEGSESEIITASTDQLLTGLKTFDKEFVMKEISTPSNPASGYQKLYFKTTGLHSKDSAGNETLITPVSNDSVDHRNNMSLATSLPGGGALAIDLKTKAGGAPTSGSPVQIAFRDSTLATGTYSIVSATAAVTLTVTSGATLGHSNTSQHYIYVYALNNAGTIELAVSSILRDEGILHNTTLMDANADSLTGFYSAAARSGVAIRFLGRLSSTQATAGTYATAISEISSKNSSVIVDNTLMSDEIATRLGFKQYLADQAGGANDIAYNGGNKATILNTSGGNIYRCVLIPYQMQDGTWRLRANMALQDDDTGTNASGTFNITGILFKNVTNFNQAISFYHAATNGGSSIAANVIPNTNTVNWGSSANLDLTSIFSFSFDVELNAKPTWAY